MNLETQDNAQLAHGQELIEEFLRHFDDDYDYRALACHAALPLVLTPELLKFLRHEFLPHLSWVAEVDLLLSRLCAEAAEDLYVMRRNARAYLIGQMRQDPSLGETRIEAVNRLLIDRLDHLARNHPALLSQEWETQRLSAMLYVTDQRDRAARELSEAIYQCLTGAGTGKMVNAPNLKKELARLTRLVREAADSMKEKEYEELVRLARLTGKVLSDRSGHYAQQLRSTGELAQTFRLPGVTVQLSAELLLERISAPYDKQKIFPGEWQETGRKTEDETPSTTLELEQIQEPPDDLIGAALVDGYKITRLIWKGHLGTDVYLAEDSSDPGDQVTVKVLNHRDLSEQLGSWAERRFEEEIRALSLRLDHPGLVKLRGHGWAPNGLRYLILEDGPQNTLRAEMNQVQAVPLMTIASIILQVAEALEYLHSNQVIYRNLKPDNIALIRDREGKERVMLTDFGLAVLPDSTGKRLEEIEGSVGSIGALRYMAPEQIVDEPYISSSSDIYALGVLAYELVTGQLPFQGNELPQQYWLQREGVRVKPRELRPNLPHAAEKAILKCLAFKESARFKRAHDFGAAFAQNILYFKFETVTLYAQGNVQDRRALQANQFLEELASGVTLSMVEIPGGEFLMGSPEDEARRLDAEGPQHRVVISPFFMGKFVITQAQWRVVAGWPKIERELNPEPSPFPRNRRRRPADDERPVDHVSWEDALEFCARLSHKTERSYRLPTEAEWEYACRAGTKTPFAFGETVTPEFVNYNGDHPYSQAPKGKYRKETVPVGSFGVANWFGLFDMHGNVWEWCQDVPHKNYHGAPTDGSAWLDGGDSSRRVLKGGSWNHNGYNCRSAYRVSSRPDIRDISFGFRVVVTARTPSGATRLKWR